MTQNTEHLAQLIKIPDLLHFVLHEKSTDRAVFLFQTEKKKDDVNCRHLICNKELKYNLTN